MIGLRFVRSAGACILVSSVAACAPHATPPSAGSTLVPQSVLAHSLRAPAAFKIAASRQRITRGDVRRAHAIRVATVGSGQPATADMPVQRPDEAPCVVQLFSNYTFTDFSQHLFSYTPPSGCTGPWAKVVFDGDFNVTAGRQYDRTASVWIAGTNVYFGTTAEPSTLSPSWHVERDVTDLSAILKSSSTGQIVLGNIVNQTYTGIISASAKLEFYPATSTYPHPQTPQVILPLSNGPLGDNVDLPTPSSQLAGTFALPRNVERAYLDVYLQSQGGDEFWYTCFPNDLAQLLNNCGNTGFREGEVAIDGQPAGVVPVYPWIYTGGIDPYLWRPIPGVETFDFKPYRVNLSPFAGMLSNGQQHTVAISVYNDGNYFAANGALLLYLDRNAQSVSGAIVRNTTSPSPSVAVQEGVVIDSQGNAKGPILVTSSHPVSVIGYVNTSHGRQTVDVEQNITFSNNQYVVATQTKYLQTIDQVTSVTSRATRTGNGHTEWNAEQRSWPLGLNYLYAVNSDGTQTQTASVRQAKVEQFADGIDAQRPYRSTLSNSVHSADTLTFYPDGTYGPSNGRSSQRYVYANSNGICYGKVLESRNYLVTSARTVNCLP